MDSPAKPFACTAPDCSMRFTNEDHLTVHSRKHDLELQLALGNKAGVFPADQTPTPTRFIRNCEEVGLFQDLQNVNPFDEGFKRAMETNKASMLISLDSAIAAATCDDALHTPHVFPNISDVSDPTIFNPSTKTLSRLSSEDSQTVKHMDSAVPSKITNAVTVRENNDAVNTVAIYKNFEIKPADYSTIVSSNDPNSIKLIIKNNEKDLCVVKKDVLLTDAGKIPVISQKSLDFAIDSLTSHIGNTKGMILDKTKPDNAKNESLINTMKKNMKNVLNKTESSTTQEVKRRGKKRRSDFSEFTSENYEVMLKLPSGELLHMKSDKAEEKPVDAKQKLKNAIESRLRPEIESQIRIDVENKINSELQLGQYILKVKDPRSINTAAERQIGENQIVVQLGSEKAISGEQMLVQLAQNKSLVAQSNVLGSDKSVCGEHILVQLGQNKSIVAQSNVLVPVKKIGIPRLKLSTPDKPKLRETRKRTVQVKEFKVIHHKPDCDILHKVGTVCSLNCAEANLKTIANAPIDKEIHATIPKEVTPQNATENVKTIKSGRQDHKTNIEVKPTIQNIIKVASENNTDTRLTIADATAVDPSVLISDMEFNGSRNSDVGTDTEPPLREVTDVPERGNVVDAEQKFKRESRVEAVRRYRSRQKNKLKALLDQNMAYQVERQRLCKELLKVKTDLAAMKKIFIDHCAVCESAESIRQRCFEILDVEVDEEKQANKDLSS